MLLDVGEKLIAEHGLAGLSIRAVTKAANANLGAVTYHFGSKEKLIEEIFLRRFRPVYQDRLARLDALEAGLKGRSLKLEEIVEILIRPVVEARGVKEDESLALMLLQRSLKDLPAETRSLLQQEAVEFHRRFDAAMLSAVPGLPLEELFWRRKFFMGSLTFGVDAWVMFKQSPDLYPDQQLDAEAFIQRLVIFVSAGMSAPWANQAP